jgi:hypothetical protein
VFLLIAAAPIEEMITPPAKLAVAEKHILKFPLQSNNFFR